MTIEVAVMIKGQDGFTWPLWKRIARTVEDLGFAGLYRSDRFTNPDGPLKENLKLWSSLLWLADNTERMEFGTLVSPVSFRDPRITAWQATATDSLSGGRLRLGVGRAGRNANTRLSASTFLRPPNASHALRRALRLSSGFCAPTDRPLFPGISTGFRGLEYRLAARRPVHRPSLSAATGGTGHYRLSHALQTSETPSLWTPQGSPGSRRSWTVC